MSQLTITIQFLPSFMLSASFAFGNTLTIWLTGMKNFCREAERADNHILIRKSPIFLLKSILPYINFFEFIQL